MIHNLTFSIDATSSCTQAVASVVYTSLITWTVSVQNALWPTTCVWITIVTLQANTGSYSLLLLTDCIRTTWRWVTWVSWTICYHWCHCCNGYEGYNLIGNKSKCVIYFQTPQIKYHSQLIHSISLFFYNHVPDDIFIF